MLINQQEQKQQLIILIHFHCTHSTFFQPISNNKITFMPNNNGVTISNNNNEHLFKLPDPKQPDVPALANSRFSTMFITRFLVKLTSC